MKLLITLFFLPAFFVSGFAQEDKPLVEILEFGYERSQQPVVQASDPGPTTPVRAVVAENKYFQRKARENLSPGAIDPNSLTVDGRSAELDRINREANSTDKAKVVNGYSYHAKFTNSYKHPIELIFWEVKFITGAAITRRQFICPINIKTGDKKELSHFTALGPSDVVDAANPNAGIKTEAAISRVEFADGAVWQRLDWSYADEKKKIKSAVEKPWGNEACRSF